MCFIGFLTVNSVHQCLHYKPWAGGYKMKKELAPGLPRGLRGGPCENLYNQRLDARRSPSRLVWLWLGFNLTHILFSFKDFSPFYFFNFGVKKRTCKLDEPNLYLMHKCAKKNIKWII